MGLILARAPAVVMAAVVALSPLAGCGLSGPPPSKGAAADAAGCAPFSPDLHTPTTPEALASLARTRREAEAAHASWRAAAKLGPEPAGGDRVRILNFFTFGGSPNGYSLVARRDIWGDWAIEQAATHEDGKPWLRRAKLTGPEAAALNRLVADRCLYADPIVGGPEGCADGSFNVIEVAVRGRRHWSEHFCVVTGRADAVWTLLLEALNASHPAPNPGAA